MDAVPRQRGNSAMSKVVVVVVVAVVVVGCASAMRLPTIPTEPRIVGGENAAEGEFPYMVSLRRKNKDPGHTCGGSVLTKNWLLTAAHCCVSIQNAKPENFYAYTGSIYLSGNGRSNPMAEVVIHEGYDPGSKWRNDICLIRLAKPLVLDGRVQQVTLPPQDWPVNSGDRVTITGWGHTDRPTITIPDVLQKGVDFVALSNEECRNRTGLALGPEYLCARGNRPEQSTWNGDSGGPLVKNRTQVGLTSFGFRPFRPGNPTVYARVTNYVNWIKQKLGPEASDLKFADRTTTTTTTTSGRATDY